MGVLACMRGQNVMCQVSLPAASEEAGLLAGPQYVASRQQSVYSSADSPRIHLLALYWLCVVAHSAGHAANRGKQH